MLCFPMCIILNLERDNKSNMGDSNMKKRFSFFSLLVLLLTLACIASGCGKKKKQEDVIKDVRENTLTINADHTIREIACQDFSDVAYDISGLKQEIKDQVEAYCKEHGEGTVVLVQYDEEDKFVRVALDYLSLKDYNDFNGTDYADDGISEVPAEEQLIDLGGKAATASDVLRDSFHAFRLDGQYNLTINGEILYYNSHVTLGEGGNKAITDGTGEAIIIYQ